MGERGDNCYVRHLGGAEFDIGKALFESRRGVGKGFIWAITRRIRRE